MKRRLLALTIVILGAVTIAGAYSWVLATRPAGVSGGPCARAPCGMPLAFSAPAESTVSGYHLYNFSVQSAGGGIVWGDLGFSLLSPSGTTISPTGIGWNISVFGLGGTALAFYELGAGADSWTEGANLAVSAAQTLVLTSPPTAPLSGGTFIVLAQGGGFQGSISVSIP